MGPLIVVALLLPVSPHGVQVDLGGGRICFMQPRIDDPVACAGLALDRMKLDPADVSAYVRLDDLSYAVTVLSSDDALGHDGVVSDADVHALADANLRGVPGARLVGDPVVTTTDDHSVIELTATVRGNALVMEIVALPDGMVSVSFAGDDTLIPQLRAVAQATMATATFPKRGGPSTVAIAGIIAMGIGALIILLALLLRRGTPEADELAAWVYRQRRAAGLRLVGVGQLVMLPALIWLVAYFDWDSTMPITRIKLVGGTTVAIGLLLTVAGVVQLVRARRYSPG